MEILKIVVEDYIKTAEPVASARLAIEFKLGWSPATIRAELTELEVLGFLTHPHTSAGRIPTEKGYRLYVEEMMPEGGLNKKDMAALVRAWKDSESENEDSRIKAIARASTELTSMLTIVSYGGNKIYFTGMSNLFNQPEFFDNSHVAKISEFLDSIDEHISAIFDNLKEDVGVLIGKDNPLDDSCGSVIAKFGESPKEKNDFFMFVGPMRMDYRRSMSLAEEIREIFNHESKEEI